MRWSAPGGESVRKRVYWMPSPTNPYRFLLLASLLASLSLSLVQADDFVGTQHSDAADEFGA